MNLIRYWYNNETWRHVYLLSSVIVPSATAYQGQVCHCYRTASCCRRLYIH